MSGTTMPDRQNFVSPVGESHADFRQRMTLVQIEAKERRQQELVEQRSPRNAPGDRIRIWERLHQLRMPVDGAHRLLAIIAANTGLSLEDVQAELYARARARAGTPIS